MAGSLRGGATARDPVAPGAGPHASPVCALEVRGARRAIPRRRRTASGALPGAGRQSAAGLDGAPSGAAASGRPTSEISVSVSVWSDTIVPITLPEGSVASPIVRARSPR